MRVYTRVVLAAATGRVIELDGFEYAGPVALCKGGDTPQIVMQNPPAVSEPAPLPPPPELPKEVKDTSEEDEEKAAEERRKRLARGRVSTLLTGGAGVLGEPVTKKKTLLGE